ncbi:Flp family type IVb pilin [Prescottella equi]|uniref:Flp family type IVb pilin n=1 Tax=Rhodococcus hoagii TaxID=43767 RepID=UPI000852964C|nr:Flp family type IVb pilin [Prescottella equi]GBF14823.1 flp/Fap pilin component [Rhodococcus sp. Br-6]AVP68276.1 Flp family type IVb pilin [Prescottella equi]MBM4474807.1 Flp family type IVb pilin [Prescottella equi]MBM4476878.1 Flp family type IVb pilin [Prescottella equi]MBM4476879.1 Flp family type IVb pilin [Prescottella equi]
MNLFFANLYLMGLDVKDRLTRDDRGATAVEYGLMVGLIAVVIIAAVILLGNNLDGLFDSVNNELPAGEGGGGQ